jgi:hypothetical protein
MTATQKTCTRILAELSALLAQHGVSSRLSLHSLAWDTPDGAEHSATCRPSRGGWVLSFWGKNVRGVTATRNVFLPDADSIDHATHDILRAATGN